MAAQMQRYTRLYLLAYSLQGLICPLTEQSSAAQSTCTCTYTYSIYNLILPFRFLLNFVAQLANLLDNSRIKWILQYQQPLLPHCLPSSSIQEALSTSTSKDQMLASLSSSLSRLVLPFCNSEYKLLCVMPCGQ